MFKSLFLALALTGLFTSSLSAAEGTVTVSGTGTVYVAPDCATLVVSVVAADKNVSKAYKEVKENTETLRTILKQASVPDTDINTLTFHFDNTYDEKGKVSGWQVVHALAIKLKKTADVGKIVDSVVLDGKVNVVSLKYDVSDRESARGKARDLAIAQALEKAGQLAKGFGSALGPIKTVTESSSSNESRSEFGAVQAQRSSVGVSGGEVGITVNLSVTFTTK